MTEETYTVTVDCGNCRAPNTVTIPRGISVHNFVHYEPIYNEDVPTCDNCGLRRLDYESPTPLIYG